MIGCSTTPSRVEEPIAGPTVIDAEPVTHRFPRPLRATLLDTSICLEVAEQDAPLPDDALFQLPEQTGLKAVLIGASGMQLPLKLSAVRQQGPHDYILGASAALFRPRADLQPFVAIRVVADRSVRISRIIWLGCGERDPDRKGGVCLPHSKVSTQGKSHVRESAG